VSPLTLGVILLWHGWSLVRTAALLVLEFVLAVVDCIRGLIDGQDLWKEFKFVPTRVAISILFREMATIGAKIDTSRGLPVIHLNYLYLGYDEQAQAIAHELEMDFHFHPALQISDRSCLCEFKGRCA
jgi:hypothetical protein